MSNCNCANCTAIAAAHAAADLREAEFNKNYAATRAAMAQFDIEFEKMRTPTPRKVLPQLTVEEEAQFHKLDNVRTLDDVRAYFG